MVPTYLPMSQGLAAAVRDFVLWPTCYDQVAARAEAPHMGTVLGGVGADLRGFQFPVLGAGFVHMGFALAVGIQGR